MRQFSDVTLPITYGQLLVAAVVFLIVSAVTRGALALRRQRRARMELERFGARRWPHERLTPFSDVQRAQRIIEQIAKTPTRPTRVMFEDGPEGEIVRDLREADGFDDEHERDIRGQREDAW